MAACKHKEGDGIGTHKSWQKAGGHKNISVISQNRLLPLAHAPAAGVEEGKRRQI
jgi:hypothetical protein